MQTLPLAHGFLAANDYGVGIVNNSVADGVGQQRIGQFLWPTRSVKLGTEDRRVSLVRDSTISNKSLASVSFKGYRSHSSIMSNAYFLYLAMNLRMVPAQESE